jgi:hypothetical protein
MDIKYITPTNMKTIMNDIGNELMDIFEKSDRELTFDAMLYDKKHSSDWMELKSTDADDLENVYSQDKRLVSVLIAQLILFKRIVRQNDVDERDMGFPKNHIPIAFRFTEDWYKSSGREMKKIFQLKEGLEDLKSKTPDSWFKYFKTDKVYQSLSKNGKMRLKRMFS